MGLRLQSSGPQGPTSSRPLPCWEPTSPRVPPGEGSPAVRVQDSLLPDCRDSLSPASHPQMPLPLKPQLRWSQGSDSGNKMLPRCCPAPHHTTAGPTHWPYTPSPSKPCQLPKGRGHLPVADHDQADKGNVDVGPQGVVMVNLIHLQGEKSMQF